MRLAALIAALASASCTGELVASEAVREQPADIAESTPARRTFDQAVAPLLDDRCRFCHGDPAMAPAFLVGNPDVYTTVVEWPSLIDLAMPDLSRLLTKGEHDGPGWDDEESETVLAWLRLEQDQAGGLADEDEDEDDGALPPPSGPCVRIDAFTALASGPLDQHCASCHAGDDVPATEALDLGGIGDPLPAAQALACARVVATIDLETPMNSTLFSEVNPLDDPEHPFRFGGAYDAFRDFRTAVLQWILGREQDP